MFCEYDWLEVQDNRQDAAEAERLDWRDMIDSAEENARAASRIDMTNLELERRTRRNLLESAIRDLQIAIERLP
jgi:hypothetical protein